MPYLIDDQNCVRKQNADGSAGPLLKCFPNDPEGAKNYLKALYANVKDSAIVDFSMSITKASYDTFNSTPRHWRAVDSDIDADLYNEKMSVELFKDFVSRIENKTPVPEEFKSVICEDSWCGGMPYLSIAHYKAGDGAKNVPGKVDAIYVDGSRLKSRGVLDDTPLGRQVFESLCEDAIKRKSGDQSHLPVRISIGFLDLEHKHTAEHGGQDFTFTRKAMGQICPLCEQGIGGKIYLKGQLVHLALTRVPVNPRTEMVAEKSMDAIITKKDDAKSIIKELADELDERSLAEGTLVVRSDGTGVGGSPTPDEDWLKPCYDPNTDTYDQNCLNRTLVANMVEMRKQMTPVKSSVDVAEISKSKSPSAAAGVSEATMAGETVEKMVLGGESVPEKKFEYIGIDGDPGNNITAAPIPVKAKADEEAGEADDSGDEEKKEKSEALDVEYAQLKSLLKSGASVEEINQKFASFASTAEKSFAPKSEPVDQGELVGVIKSLTDSIKAMQIEMAQLKAGVATKSATSATPAPRSLVFKPEDFMLKAQTNAAPKRKLTQIEMIARRSTGASIPE